MATYEYSCADHGISAATAPLGCPPPSWRCPACGGSTRRVYAAVTLLVGGPYARAIEAAERTSAEPQVVTRLPETKHWRSRGGHPSAPQAHFARLPRP